MTQDIIPPAKSWRGTGIKNLTPSLPERGKIKIGRKGDVRKSSSGSEYQLPEKQGHFTVTTLEKGPDGNFVRDEMLHKILGDKPTKIPVRLLYDDPSLNLMTRYAVYKGKTLWCSGDGETAEQLGDDGKNRVEVKCPCFRQDYGYDGDDKCKINGVLSVLIDQASGIGGVWKFRTTSYNSVVSLLSSMNFIRYISSGPLAGLGLDMTLREKIVTIPNTEKTTKVWVVDLHYRGDEASLRMEGHRVALDRATARISIEMVETEARRMLAAPANAPLPGDDAEDVVSEFYSEQVIESDAPPPPKRTDFALQDPLTIKLNGTDPDALKGWAVAFVEAIRAADSAEMVEAIVVANKAGIDAIAAKGPKMHEAMMKVIAEVRSAFAPVDEAAIDREARAFAGQAPYDADTGEVI